MCSFDKNPISFTAFTRIGENDLLTKLRRVVTLNLWLILQALGEIFVFLAINVTPYIPHSLVFAAHFFVPNGAIERVDIVFSRRLQEWI